MAKITGVHHIALTPTKEDYEKTVDFYQNTLGFDPVRAWGDEVNKCVMLSCGDNTVMEIMNKGEGPMGDGAFVHVAFSTDQPDEILEEVRKQGYAVTMEPQSLTIASQPPYPVRVAFFRGPVGEHIELFKVC